MNSGTPRKNQAQKNTKRELIPVVYFEMFSLRILGLNYKEIATKTGYSHDWIRHLFSRDGVFSNIWSDWLKTAKEDNIDEAINIMFGHLPDIVRARVKHAKGQSMGSVASSKMILDYTLGKPEDRPKIGDFDAPRTFTELVRKETLEIEKERKEGIEFNE